MDAARERQRALERAFKSLAVRERTEQEMRGFLAKRGYEGDVVDDVIATLVDERLIDDAGYAERFAEDRRVLDQWGSERIARDLGRRGVDRELIDGALARIGDDEELEIAVEILDRRFPMPLDGDRDRDKAWRMLVRRGYQPELAYEAVRRHEQG
jgi:regulatory protein